MPGGILTDLLLIAFLLLVNAFFAAAEIALASARTVRLEQQAEAGSAAARTALELAAEPARFLSTVQVGITLAAFFTSAVGAASLSGALAAPLAALPGPLGAAADSLAFVFVTVALAFVSIVVGELVPKTLAVQAADRVAVMVAGPIATLARLARPVVALLTGTTNLLLRLLGSRARARMPSITEEELLALIEAGEDEGVLDPAEAAMAEGVFGLGDRRARELMVPRVDVVALPAAATVGEARRLFAARGFSRLPVHEGGLDRVVGVLYVKDLVALAGPDADAGPVGPLARPPLFVPEGQPALALLAQLQRERRHLAVVVDEHGGTAGVVTLEDVLEEIVGEIADEFEPAGEAALARLAAGTAEVAGALPLADLNDALDLALAEPGVDTVGGLVTARLGRFARPGDVIEVGEARLEVLRADGARVRRVRVTRPPDAPDRPDGDGA